MNPLSSGPSLPDRMVCKCVHERQQGVDKEEQVGREKKSVGPRRGGEEDEGLEIEPSSNNFEQEGK